MAFNENLKKRMHQKNINTKELARRIFNNNSNFDLWENAEKKDQNALVKKIQRWQSGESKPKSLDDFSILCDIIDCDPSYLLDKSQVTNLNNKKVAKFLGLDEVTVSSIKDYSYSIKKMLNTLVRANEHDEHVGDILKEILEILLLECVSASDKEVVISNKRTGETTRLSGKKATRHLLSTFDEYMNGVFFKVAMVALDKNMKSDKEKENEKERKWQEEIEKLKKENIEQRKMIDEMKNKMQQSL